MATLGPSEQADPSDARCTCLCIHDLPPPPRPDLTAEEIRDIFKVNFRSHETRMASLVERLSIKAENPGQALTAPVVKVLHVARHAVPFTNTLVESFCKLTSVGFPIYSAAPLAFLWTVSCTLRDSYTVFPTLQDAAKAFGVFGFSLTGSSRSTTFRLPAGLLTFTIDTAKLPKVFANLFKAAIDFEKFASAIFATLVAPNTELLVRYLTTTTRNLPGIIRDARAPSYKVTTPCLKPLPPNRSTQYETCVPKHVLILNCATHGDWHDATCSGRLRSCPRIVEQDTLWCSVHDYGYYSHDPLLK
jgi:hypothetical protein